MEQSPMSIEISRSSVIRRCHSVFENAFHSELERPDIEYIRVESQKSREYVCLRTPEGKDRYLMRPAAETADAAKFPFWIGEYVDVTDEETGMPRTFWREVPVDAKGNFYYRHHRMAGSERRTFIEPISDPGTVQRYKDVLQAELLVAFTP